VATSIIAAHAVIGHGTIARYGRPLCSDLIRHVVRRLPAAPRTAVVEIRLKRCRIGGETPRRHRVRRRPLDDLFVVIRRALPPLASITTSEFRMCSSSGDGARQATVLPEGDSVCRSPEVAERDLRGGALEIVTHRCSCSKFVSSNA
jgi:hypothetical protein